jgi:predicted MFS family arabinose efflux permease
MKNKTAGASERAAQLAWDLLTAEDDGRVCRDIPESACNDQPKNFVTHIIALSMTKLADGLLNPKLILSWILSSLGAPAYFVGWLVPIREAGALLPQLFIASYIRSLPVRKIVWTLGSIVQGICATGIALAAMNLEGFKLGLTVVSLLGALALARSLCSVSYKDVLGKTVGKSKRGTATGTASSIAASGVLAYALALSSGWFETKDLLIAGLFLAGALWITASLLFTRLTEEEGATEGGGNQYRLALENIGSLARDRQLILFIFTRALLIATALAPPFMVALNAGNASGGLSQLGLLLLASSLAGLGSSYVWGRLADRSSRWVLILAAIMSSITLFLTVLLARSDLMKTWWLLPSLLFGLMVAYEGVRLGRSTHLVDMASEDQRALYTALSNTIIGILLFLGGFFSLVANAYGSVAVLAIFAMMCLLATIPATLMKEVQI